jgi:hypothetical protein
MKLTRKQLRRLIEARIKPSMVLPDEYSDLQPTIDDLAKARSEDSMGRQYADNTFDSIIDPILGVDDQSAPFSQREFEYDYPMIQDPAFKKGVEDLFEIFMYENKVFANDIYSETLEGYQELVRDFFTDELPRMSQSPGYFRGNIPASLLHTFKSGKIPYQLTDVIRKIVDPISERIYNEWQSM